MRGCSWLLSHDMWGNVKWGAVRLLVICAIECAVVCVVICAVECAVVRCAAHLVECEDPICVTHAPGKSLICQINTAVSLLPITYHALLWADEHRHPTVTSNRSSLHCHAPLSIGRSPKLTLNRHMNIFIPLWWSSQWCWQWYRWWRLTMALLRICRSDGMTLSDIWSHCIGQQELASFNSQLI